MVVTERRHEHEYFDLRPADLNQTLAESICSCPARCCLEPRRRQRVRLQRVAAWLHGACSVRRLTATPFSAKKVLAQDIRNCRDAE
ncbi:hypothetical protein ABIC08_009365 [Bradyrhizobium sp. RT9b]|uniref:hypothetical protein n=1 Tax=Bradyrhizobium sp. RT9b TaxID=3156385 RepID=UPI0033915A4D